MPKGKEKKRANGSEKIQGSTIALYVKHLPVAELLGDEVPLLPVKEWDSSVPTDVWVTLLLRRVAYQERGDAVALIEAFLLAHDAGLYPPMWVLDALAKGFHTYYKRQGKKPLADALGLNLGPGKSQFKQSAIEELHEQLALQMYQLRLCFSLSVADAAVMLEAKLKRSPVVNTTEWKGLGKNYVAETFSRNYSRWRKAARLEESVTNPFHPDNKDHPWTKAQRRSFLTSFPRESWDHLIKKCPRLHSIL